MIDEATYSELDRYFHSQMNAEERSAFELQLNANEELRKELSWLLYLEKSMSIQGKAVMKQVVAGALAGIPDKAIAKYKPSINGKSFLKKWWWAIAAGTLILAATAWFAISHYTTQSEHCLDCTEQNGLVVPEASTNVDSLIEAMNAIDTLCIDSAQPEAANELSEHREVAFVSLGREPKGLQLTKAEVAKEIPLVGVLVDTSMNLYYAWDTKKPDSVDKERPMDVMFRPHPNVQPAYIYDGQKLTLIGPYSTIKGLTFSAQGDSLIMRDGQPGYFVLRKVIKEKPLVRKVSVRAAK